MKGRNKRRTHDGSPADGPLRAILEVRPDRAAIARLRRVDAADREPHDEDQDNNDIENGADLVELADEPG